MTATLRELGSFATFLSGGTPSVSNAAFWNGSICWASPKDMHLKIIRDTEDHISEEAVSSSATRVVPPNTILVVTRFSILVRRLPVALTASAMAFNQDIKAILVDRNVALPEYVTYALSNAEADILRNGVKKGATVHSLVGGYLEKFMLPVPSLSEQQRIVDILDRAAGIQRLRKTADDKVRELIPALFVDMFGDPAANPKGWETKKFGEVGTLDRGKSRHRPRDAKELYGGPYPFVQTGDVANSGGYINRSSSTYSELGLAQSRLWGAGTLCITIAANIAKTGILEIEACFPDSVVGFTPNHLVLTEFVRAWLGFLQPILEKNAPQAAQKNINLEILRDLEIPVPPVPLQERFDGVCKSVRSTKMLANDALEMSAAISAAISSSSFR